MAPTTSSPTWQRGDAYEQYVGRWSRRVAPQFLAWLNLPAGLRWLDVGCGTGVLSAAMLAQCSPASVTGVEPSEGFLNKARQQLPEAVRLLAGHAAAIPLDTGACDATVSGLVLNFVPDALAALREMARVTAAGGTIAAYVWDYAGKMELMRHFWDAAIELDPLAADEGPRFPICRPEALGALFAQAGLANTATTAIDIATDFASFDDYWQPFLGGQGPAPAYAMALDEAARKRLRDRLEARIPAQADGSLRLAARAWAVRATTAQPA